MIKEFLVEPMGKPRMTRSDQWKIDPNHRDPRRRKRKCVVKYHNFQNALLAQVGDFKMPESNYQLTFFISMPASWSAKRKAAMAMKPHQTRPDKDNLEKAFLDAICEDDAHIWDGRVSKFWGYTGKIVLEF